MVKNQQCAEQRAEPHYHAHGVDRFPVLASACTQTLTEYAQSMAAEKASEEWKYQKPFWQAFGKWGIAHRQFPISIARQAQISRTWIICS